MSHPDDRLSIEARQTADNSLIIGESTVACQHLYFREQGLHVIQGVGPLWVTGHLYRLPGTKLAVNTLQLLARLDFQAIGVGDRMLMLEYGVYSVISPEGCASILWKNAAMAADCSKSR